MAAPTLPDELEMEIQDEEPKPCHLLALPAELRLLIYTFTLAPTGSIYLHRTPSKRHAVTPSSISPALLATNKQIHAEAEGVLYTENTVHMAIDAHDTTWPAVNEARLPLGVLRRLEYLCLLLDCTAVIWRGYGDVDFGALTALTALKGLRLRALVLSDVVEREEDEDEDGNGNGVGNAAPQVDAGPVEPTWKFPAFGRLAAEILERVPASTKVSYGVEAVEGEDEGLVEGPRAPFDQFYTPKYKLSTMPGQSYTDVAREVNREDLEASVRGIEDLEGRRGCQAGSVKDPWGDYRDFFHGMAKATRV